MNTIDLASIPLRLGALLASVYGGYVLSLFLNCGGKLPVRELLPNAALGSIWPVAFITGPYGTCFALEAAICFGLLLFDKYPLACCLLLAFFSFFFRMFVFASWTTSWEFYLPRWSIAVLPFLGAAILIGLIHTKR